MRGGLIASTRLATPEKPSEAFNLLQIRGSSTTPPSAARGGRGRERERESRKEASVSTRCVHSAGIYPTEEGTGKKNIIWPFSQRSGLVKHSPPCCTDARMQQPYEVTAQSLHTHTHSSVRSAGHGSTARRDSCRRRN